ncbi:MAG: MFS transporter [Capsulimonadaceae bacterium]|nr:MFS transporter [Capsulimonadaceae bacterium]
MIEDATDNRPDGLSRTRLRGALRLWIIEGSIATVYGTLTTGPFQTGYAIALGCSNVLIGLLTGIPAMLGLLQLAGPSVMRRFASRRDFVAFFSVIARFVWLPLLLIPYVLPRHLWVPALLGLTFVSSVIGAIPAATWVDWMSDLVPFENRGRYFGLRAVYLGVTGMVVSVAGGLFFDHALRSYHWNKLQASSLLFAIGLLFALGSFICCRMSPDVPAKPLQPNRSLLSLLRTPFADAKFRGVLNFTLANVVCQTIAGQFFLVYMLQYLRMSYSAIQLLGTVASVASFVAMPLVGYLADKYGNKPILVLSCVFVIFAPFMWCLTVPDAYAGMWTMSHGHLLLSNSKLIIILLNLISGIGWAGVGITQFNIIVNAAPSEDRTSYVGANSALVGLVGGICPLIGGGLLDFFKTLPYPDYGLIRNGYHALFFLAGILRFLMIAYAMRLDEPESRSARYVLGQLRAARPVGSFTAIHRLGRSGDSRTRVKAAEQLGRLKTPVAVEELVKALDDVSLPVREQAATSLGEIGDARAVQPLVTKLTDVASGIAPEAAVALGKIGDKSALPALAAVIQLGGPSLRRLAAIEALGRLQDRRVPDILLPIVSERDSSVRVAATRALSGFPEAMHSDRVVAALLDQWQIEMDATVLPSLAEALAATGRAELAPRLLDVYDRVVSPLVEREILNSTGSLLGGQDSFYAYLVLDGDARDETVRKILTNLQKLYRKAGSASNARAAVRIRQALYEYLDGQYDRAAIHLYKASCLLRSLDSNKAGGRGDDPGHLVLAAIADRAETSISIAAEEVLLGVFILRLGGVSN